jgi:hypothetical protein
MAVLSVQNLIPEQPRTPAKKTRNRLPEAQVLRRQVIFGVLELKLTGLHYCRELDRRKLPTPATWQENGCAATYAAAYRVRDGLRVSSMKSRISIGCAESSAPLK